MKWSKVVAVTALGLALGYGAAAPVQAKSEVYENQELGFRLKLPDDFKLIPPELENDQRYKLAEWYVDKAKYDRGLQPTLELTWFSTPKKGAVTPSGGGPQDGGQEGAPEVQIPAEYRSPTSLYDYAYRRLKLNPRFFGKVQTVDQHREEKSAVDTVRSKSKIEWDVTEINYRKPKNKKEERPLAYMMLARLELERQLVLLVVIPDLHRAAPLELAEQ